MNAYETIQGQTPTGYMVNFSYFLYAVLPVLQFLEKDNYILK